MLRQFSVKRIAGFFLLDWLGTLAALYLAGWLRNHAGALPAGLAQSLESVGIAIGGAEGLHPSSEPIQSTVYLMVALLWPLFFVSFSVYDGRHNESLKVELKNVALGVFISAASLSGFLFLTYRETSRVLFLFFILLDLAFLLGSRLLWTAYRRYVVNGIQRRRKVLVIGAGLVGMNAVQQLRRYAWSDLDILGFLDDDPNKQGDVFAGLPVLGTLDQAKEIFQEKQVDVAIMALPLRAHDRLLTISRQLQELYIHVYVIPDLFSLSFPNASLEGFGGIPMMDLGQPGIQGWRRLVKRVFDVAVATFGLIVISPLLLVLALLVKLSSPGPIFYRQVRIGENGRPFTMFKFRSMRVNCDTDTHQAYVTRLIRENLTVEQVTRETGQKSLKMTHDPRITPIGKFIRKTSLDELPQVFNVLRGDMSMVGPRPSLPYEVAVFQNWHKRRFEAPPGITGLWQVKGRNRVSFDEMVRMDLEYIEKQSFWMDCTILLQTPIALLLARGAG